MSMESEREPPHLPQNRDSAPSKLRRDGKHCPVCLAKFARNAKRTRSMRQCVACRAHPQVDKACARCGKSPVWQGPAGAACPACGAQGAVADIIAARSSD